MISLLTSIMRIENSVAVINHFLQDILLDNAVSFSGVFLAWDFRRKASTEQEETMKTHDIRERLKALSDINQ